MLLGPLAFVAARLPRPLRRAKTILAPLVRILLSG
jgi:hypothetical protein